MKSEKKIGSHNLQKELERVQKLKKEAKDSLKLFRESLVMRGLSEERQYFLLLKLRLLEQNVEGGIFPLTEKKVKKAMLWVMGNDYEKWTIIGYQIALSQYWRFGVSKTLPAEISDILKIKRDKKHKLKATDLISVDDMNKILDNCLNTRDKALFSLLYDSGLRHNEVLNLRNKDLEFDKYGVKIIVPEEGKTGTRMVRITRKDRSIPFLREWQRDHPRRNDKDAYLFCKVELKTRGQRIAYQDLNRILNDVLRRGNIEKRIYPHLFRHTRASILAAKVAQRPLEMQMGWVAGTSMLGTYAHLDDEAQDRAILEKYGITKEESEMIETKEPVRCPTCGEENDYKARFCWKCGFILEEGTAKYQIEKTTNALKESNLISDDAKDLLDPDNLKGLAKLLIKIEKSGQLDKLFELVRKKEDH